MGSRRDIRYKKKLIRQEAEEVDVTGKESRRDRLAIWFKRGASEGER